MARRRFVNLRWSTPYSRRIPRPTAAARPFWTMEHPIRGKAGMKRRKGLMLAGTALFGALLASSAQAAGADDERRGSGFSGEKGTNSGNVDSVMSGADRRAPTGSSSTGGAMEDGTSSSTALGTGSGAAGDANAGGAKSDAR